MTEELVTLETAKLLKEKGFDETYEYCILDQDDDVIGASRDCIINEKIVRHKNIKNAMPIPSLYQAQKWLREIKGVYVWVEPVIGKKWKVSFCDFNVPTEDSDWMENEINKGNGYPVYDTYEKALETGILEALKLI